MLNHFDTVFAFVAVFAGASLVVTTLTQMAGALFALRGRHLRQGLAGLLANYAPELRSHAGPLSAHLLDHPLLSDSLLARRLWVPRGRIGRLFHYLWRGWKYANVVRPGEIRLIALNLTENFPAIQPLVDEALEVIGDGSDAGEAYPKLRAVAGKLAAAGGLPGYWQQVLEAFLQASKDGVDAAPAVRAHFARGLTDLFQAMEGARLLAARFAANPTSPVSSSAASSASSVAAPEPATWERWFDGAMDRVTQHFTTSMRWCTIAFSILVAVGLPLDALGLFRRLSEDPELRAQVISGSEALMRRADEWGTTADASPAAYAEAWREMTRRHPVPLALIAAPTNFLPLSGLTNTIAARLTALVRSNALPADTRAGDITNAARIAGWIGEFADLAPQAQLRLSAERLRAVLADRASILPGIGRDVSSGEPARPVGVGISAVLLSLGAPFWFNLLRKMSNLRPSLANKEENERNPPSREPAS